MTTRAAKPRAWTDLLADRFAPPAVDAFGILGYTPTQRQAEFHAAGEDDVLFGGAGGPGKTLALVAHGIRACVEHPHINVGGFLRSYPEIERTFVAKLQDLGFAAALGAKWSASRFELSFPNGSRMRFYYVETIEDAVRLQGSEFQLILIDERTLIPPPAVELIVARLRSKRGGAPVLGVRSASNPGGLGHGAVKSRYIDATDHGHRVATDEQGRMVRFIPARLSDNPHVDAAAYERQLQGISDPTRRRALMEGDWSVHQGAAFPQWSHERHVVDPFQIPASWSRYAAIDWGFRAPWAVLWGAEDEDGRLWLYRELYAVEVGEREQARRILEASAGDGQVAMVMDPAAWARRGDAASICDAYIEAGLDVRPADNNRISGVSRVHEFLGDGPACRLHRARGDERCPLLHVFLTCGNLIRTLPELIVDPHRPEDVNTHGEDHCYDALRYMVMEMADSGPRFPILSAAAFRGEGTDLRLPAFGPYVLPPPGWSNEGWGSSFFDD